MALICASLGVQLTHGPRAVAVDGPWQPTQHPMAASRTGAIRLDPAVCQVSPPPADYPCGKVLLIGGDSPRAELYDSATDTSTLTAPDPKTTDEWPSFSYMTALLSNGKVLVLRDTFTFDHNKTPPAPVGLYDPANNRWEDAPSPPDARNCPVTIFGLPEGACRSRRGTATRIGTGPSERVLVIGGTSGGGMSTEVQLYNPSANTWTEGPPMRGERGQHTATLLANGDVLVVGPSNLPDEATPEEKALARNPYYGTAELYRPGTGASGTWTTVSMNSKRYGHSATLLNDGSVLVVGGSSAEGENSEALSSAEVYHPGKTGEAGVWSPAPPMRYARSD